MLEEDVIGGSTDDESMYNIDFRMQNQIMFPKRI
jgi:hypothetical protein